MNFSVKSFLLVIAIASVILGIVFLTPPVLGYLAMSFLALTAMPAFVQVGVFTTTGLRRSFFIGTAIAGSPHFAINAWYLWALILEIPPSGLERFSELNDYYTDARSLVFIHLGFIFISLSGGVAALVSHLVLHGLPGATAIKNKNTAAQNKR